MDPLNIGSSPSPIPIGAPKSDSAVTPGAHSPELKATALNTPVFSRDNLTRAHRSPAVKHFVEGIGEILIRNLKDLGTSHRAKATGRLSRWLAQEFCAVDDRYARKDRDGHVIKRPNGQSVPNDAAAVKLLNERMTNREFPEAVIVAMSKTKVLGTASFVKHNNPQLSAQSGRSPMTKLKGWLADLYVREAYRGKGVGSLLLNAVEQQAGKIASSIHLYTADQQSFYSKRGWTALRHDKAGGGPVTIMKKELGTPKPPGLLGGNGQLLQTEFSSGGEPELDGQHGKLPVEYLSKNDPQALRILNRLETDHRKHYLGCIRSLKAMNIRGADITRLHQDVCDGNFVRMIAVLFAGRPNEYRQHIIRSAVCRVNYIEPRQMDQWVKNLLNLDQSDADTRFGWSAGLP